MARIPLVAVSIASAAVLFVGTSASILAFQGRLGALLGKAHDPAASGATDSKPAGGTDGSANAPGGIASSAPTQHTDPMKTSTNAETQGSVAPTVSEIVPPKRIATASLVHHFTF